jgi:uncharacterized protein with PIN domain
LTLHVNDQQHETVVRVEATLDETGEECQLVLIDVTQEHQAQAQSPSQQTFGKSRHRMVVESVLMQ